MPKKESTEYLRFLEQEADRAMVALLYHAEEGTDRPEDVDAALKAAEAHARHEVLLRWIGAREKHADEAK